MIKINNATKIFSTDGNDVVAVDSVNISLESTGMTFILGKSGSGKSTLLNLIAGLLPLTGGEIIVGQYSVNGNKKSSDYCAVGYGIIFQDYRLIEHLTVRQNMEIVCSISNKPFDNIGDVLASVGMSEYSGNKIYELSGGECQRVAIALALCKDVKLILADEPTGNLDKKNSANIFSLLKELSKDRLVIVVSHDNLSAEEYADRIITLKDGKVIADENNAIAAAGFNIGGSIENKSDEVDKTYCKADTKIGEPLDNKISQGIIANCVCNEKPCKTGTITFTQSTMLAVSTFRKRPIRYLLTLMLIILTLGISVMSVGTIIATDPVNVYRKMTAEGYDKYVYFEADYLSKNETTGKLADTARSVNYDIVVDEVVIGRLDNSFFSQSSNVYDVMSQKINVISADNNMGMTYLAGRNVASDGEVVVSEFTARAIMRYGLMKGGRAEQFTAIADVVGENINFSTAGEVCEIVGVFGSFNSSCERIFGIENEAEFIKAIESQKMLISELKIDNRLNATYIVQDATIFKTIDLTAENQNILVSAISNIREAKIIGEYNIEYLAKQEKESFVMSPHLAAMVFDAELLFHHANKTLGTVKIVMIVLTIAMLALTALILVYTAKLLKDDNIRMFGTLKSWGMTMRSGLKIKLQCFGSFMMIAVVLSVLVGFAAMVGSGAFAGYMANIGRNLIF